MREGDLVATTGEAPALEPRGQETSARQRVPRDAELSTQTVLPGQRRRVRYHTCEQDRAEIKAHTVPWASHTAADPPGKRPDSEPRAARAALRTGSRWHWRKWAACGAAVPTAHAPPRSAEKLRRGGGLSAASKGARAPAAGRRGRLTRSTGRGSQRSHR